MPGPARPRAIACEGAGAWLMRWHGSRAVLAGLGEIRIVHGVGRGVLRAAVERHLRGHPQVASQRMGQVGEGGRGVTVVRLK